MLLRRSALPFLAALLILAACRPIPTGTLLPDAPGGTSAAPFAVDFACTGGQPATVDAPDPFVYRWLDGAYYAFTTSGAFMPSVPVYKSTDLVTWRLAGPDGDNSGCPDGSAMPTLASWTQYGCNWAPSVIDSGNPVAAHRFVMYYTARVNGQGTCPGPGLQCVGIAYSAHADGPYADPYSQPRLCQSSRGGTIDASPFADLGGKRYLLYKSEDSAIWSSELTQYGQVIGAPHVLLTLASGPAWEQPRIEGPTMIRTASGLFLFYSAGNWATDGYKVGVARCDTPLGPCRRVYSTPVLQSRSAMVGPGGETPFTDTGGQWRMAFHAWQSPKVGYTPNPFDPNNGQRSLRLLKLFFDGPGGNPRISS